MPARHARDIGSRPDAPLNTNKNLNFIELSQIRLLGLGKPLFNKNVNFMKKFHKQGGGESTGFKINFSDILKLKLQISIDCQINHISKTLSVKGALPHILGVHSLTHNRPLDLVRGCSHITSAKNRGSYTPPPPSSAFVSIFPPALLYYNFRRRLFDMIKWGIFIC